MFDWLDGLTPEIMMIWLLTWRSDLRPGDLTSQEGLRTRTETFPINSNTHTFEQTSVASRNYRRVQLETENLRSHIPYEEERCFNEVFSDVKLDFVLVWKCLRAVQGVSWPFHPIVTLMLAVFHLANTAGCYTAFYKPMRSWAVASPVTPFLTSDCLIFSSSACILLLFVVVSTATSCPTVAGNDAQSNRLRESSQEGLSICWLIASDSSCVL